MLKRRAEEHFAGEEQHDKFRRRLARLPVALRTELTHVGANLIRVFAQLERARCVVRAFHRLEISLQRHFRIDDDILVARQLDYDVGPEAATLGGLHFLLEEVAMLDHSGDFDDALQLNLAPSTAHCGRAQRIEELVGLRTEAAQLLAELALDSAPVVLHLA